MRVDVRGEGRAETQDALPRLLSVREVSRALGVSISKVYELVAAHELGAFRPGGRIRIPEGAVLEYLERTRVS